MTQHQCTAARFRAKCSPHCSMLFCKTGSQQAVCHCTYTYGDLLFIQVCIETCRSYRCAVTHTNCGLVALPGAKCSSQFLVLLYKTGSQHALCHCKYTYGGWLFVQVCRDPTPMHIQVCSDLAPMHCSKIQG